MARMIPGNVTTEDFNDSIGEMRVYDAMKALPDEYVVFHSVKWNRRKHTGRVFWGEVDYVVFLPSRGILMIEVKDGEIRAKDGEWYQTNRRTGVERRLEKSPMEQVNFGKYAFLDILKESQSEYARKLRVEPVVWFTSLDDLKRIDDLPADFNECNVFTEKSFDKLEETFARAFDYYGFPKDLKPGNDEKDEVIKTFAPEFNLVQSMVGMADEQNFVFNKLTREQAALLDYLDEQRVAAIQGAGGTGKTLLALEKARRLAEDGPVLMLCFNNMLLNFLRENREEKLDVTFFNLYGLCKKHTAKEKIEEKDIEDFLNHYDKYGWKYKHIIVDEGQDFSSEQLALLNTIADMNDGCFYVFYDKNQLVQRYDENDWLKNVDCRMVLSRNCRNTLSIAKTAYRTIGIEKVRMGVQVDGKKPTLIMVEKPDFLIERLVDLIRSYTDAGFLKKQIVILTLRTESTSILAGRESIGGYKLKSSLDGDGILFTSARKFKGLESDIVIVVDFDGDAFVTDENKRLFYVAASRAKHYLDFLSCLSDEEMDDLVWMLEGERRKNSKMALASALKIKVAE